MNKNIWKPWTVTNPMQRGNPQTFQKDIRELRRL